MEEMTERDLLTRQVIRMTIELSDRLRAHMARAAAQLDLTPMQARALFHSGEPVPMGGLAEHLHCDASNITGIVDRLEERGLMERVVDVADRRRRNLVITEEGRALAASLRAHLREGNPVLTLGEEELTTLVGLLERTLSAAAETPST